MKESTYKFGDPWISFVEYRDNEKFDPSSFDGDMDLKFNTDLSRGENEALCSLTIELGGTEQHPFYLKLELSAVFYWEQTQSEEEIDKFLKFNAVSLLIGYARPIVATITSSSRFPTFNLPFINITE